MGDGEQVGAGLRFASVADVAIPRRGEGPQARLGARFALPHHRHRPTIRALFAILSPYIKSTAITFPPTAPPDSTLTILANHFPSE